MRGKTVPTRVNLREGGVCAAKEMTRAHIRQGLHHLFGGHRDPSLPHRKDV